MQDLDEECSSLTLFMQEIYGLVIAKIEKMKEDRLQMETGVIQTLDTIMKVVLKG